VFGTYSQQVVDFDRERSERGDPIENVGGIYVISRNGELAAKLYPGGWLCTEPVVADDGTLLASVNDEGYGYRDPAPGTRLVALEPDGSIRWKLDKGFVGGPPAVSNKGTVFVPIETAYSESTVGAIESCLLAVDLATGTELWRYDCGDAPVAALAVGQDGTVYCGTQRTWPDSVGSPGTAGFNPRGANQLGRLKALDRSGSLKWSTALGGSFWAGLALGPDNEISVLATEWGSPEQANRLFGCTWWLKTYDNNGQLLWQYKTEYETHLHQLAKDAAGTTYLGAVWLAGRNPGVIAVSPQGEERWMYYTGNSRSDNGPITVDDSGALLLAVNNSITKLAAPEP